MTNKSIVYFLFSVCPWVLVLSAFGLGILWQFIGLGLQVTALLLLINECFRDG